MRDTEVLDSAILREVVHRDEVVTVRRQWHHLPPEDDQPPLVVERTVSTDGPSRPPVLLVHGFCQNRFSWRISGRSLVARLAQEGFEVLNVELRGHGLSREAGAGNADGFGDYVDDVTRIVSRLPEAPFLVGHSLGGAVGVGVSTRMPLAGLVPLAGVYTFATRNPTIRALGRLSLAAGPLLPASARLSTGWIGRMIGRLYSVSDVAGFGFPIAGWTPGSVERELLEERLERGMDWTSVEVWLQMSRWANGERLAYADAFQQTDVPLLVIVGDRDPLVSIADARCCYEESGSSDKQLAVFDAFEHQVHWGHLDLILGKKAPEEVWPRLVGWMVERAG